MKSFFSGMRKCKCHINIKTEGLEETKRSSEVQIRSNRNNFCHHHEFSLVLHVMKFYFSDRGSPNDINGTGKYEQVLSVLLPVIFPRLFEANHLNDQKFFIYGILFLTSGSSSGIESVFLLAVKCIKFFQRITNYDRT